ncbi:MAG: hypothetical protein HGA55_03555, partial [Methanoregulaceae archaeon]|nr:hypothetical protein [Methanoregulaceae archaeon]
MKQNKKIAIICVLTLFAIAAVFPGTAAVVNGPDLLALSVTGPGSAVAGKTVSLSITLQNIGSASAGSSYAYYYLSKDTTFTPDDIYIGKDYCSSLSPGATKKSSFSGRIPKATEPGQYYFVALADGSLRVAETNEGNNAVSSTVPVSISGAPRPDLVVSAVSAPGSCSPGSKVSISSTVKNIGSASASSSYIAFYLSPDTLLDAGDVSLGRASVSYLSSGSEKNIAASLTIPAGTSEGTYVIIAHADSAMEVSESNEGNNDGFSGPCRVILATPPGGSFTAQVESAILTYVNQERVNAGVTPLSSNAAL